MLDISIGCVLNSESK